MSKIPLEWLEKAKDSEKIVATRYDDERDESRMFRITIEEVDSSNN